MNAPGFRNLILKNLSQESIQRLELVKVRLPVPREMECPGSEVRSLVFVENGLASMTTNFADGSQIEVGVSGYEAVLGASAFLGPRLSVNHVYMQIDGWGYRSRLALGIEEFERHGEFQRLVLRYVQALLAQTSQAAGCNARHSVQQRLARWLLQCEDRLAAGPMALSQEFLAQMLGNRRTSVSVEAGKLQKLGLIRYSRGKVEIRDREGLERKSCECYRIIRRYLLDYALETPSS